MPNYVGVHAFDMDEDLNYVAKRFEMLRRYRRSAKGPASHVKIPRP